MSGAHLCLVAKKVKVKYEQFCPNLFCPFFSPYLGWFYFGGVGEKTCESHQNLSHFLPSSQQNNYKKKKFHPIFLSFIFDPPYNHSNQTKPETHIGTP